MHSRRLFGDFCMMYIFPDAFEWVGGQINISLIAYTEEVLIEQPAKQSNQFEDAQLARALHLCTLNIDTHAE